MLRRVLALATGALITGAGALAIAPPAQAAAVQPARALATVDVTFGPVSIGDYCYAKVNTSSFIGFYESGGVNCYTRGTGGNLSFVGRGDPYLACKYLTPDVVMSAFAGTGGALVCRVVR
ncbi:hypothetical protein [Sphaerisporangium fuscum]|uniref:hypothetical protein n=1 Tax=Sphaerisporangium fuscum TaxID=2835868 RepID=UPI001BDC0085|nr:hypothetical protein [Sphaerisporangium fuscum]